MKPKFLIALALVAAILLPAAPSSAALAPYFETISTSQTNDTTTLGFRAAVVVVTNDGSNEVFVRWDAAAVAGGTSSIQVPAGKFKKWLFAVGKGPQTVGIINSSGETSSVRIEAYPYDGQVETFPVGETVVDGDPATNSTPRANLVEDALQVYGIPITRIVAANGAALTAAETAGTFDTTIGTNTMLANGEVTDNETEASVAYFQFVLPPEYVAGGDVTIRLPVSLQVTGTPTNNGSTIDLEVYEQSDAGAVGSDLCATAAQTFAALSTWYNKDFTITATGLVAGDVLNVKITSSVIDSEAGAGTIILNLAPPKVLLDIKG